MDMLRRLRHAQPAAQLADLRRSRAFTALAAAAVHLVTVAATALALGAVLLAATGLTTGDLAVPDARTCVVFLAAATAVTLTSSRPPQ